MAGHLVPTVRTSCTDFDLCKSIIKNWFRLYNKYPSKASVGVLTAQHNLETGQSNDFWDWNVANVKYVDTNGNVDYCVLSGVWEIVNGKKVVLPMTDPGARFRAFSTLDDGVSFYLHFVSTGRYQNAWTAVESGNPGAFSHLLKLASFYSASEQSYTSAINVYFNRYMKDTIYERAIVAAQAEGLPPSMEPGNNAPMVVAPDPQPTTPAIVIPEVNTVGNATFLDKLWALIMKLFKK